MIGSIMLFGLGSSASSLIVSTLGLYIEVSVSPPEPPPTTGGSGGGGGSLSTLPYYTPAKSRRTDTRVVSITVKVAGKYYDRSYIVSKKKADIVVKVIDFVNILKARVNVGIERVKKAITASVSKDK